MMQKQVDKGAYGFGKYCDQDRWSSFWHQIDEILNCQPSNVLEIGPGNKVLADYLKNNTGIIYHSLDIAEDLQPDIICSIDDLKVGDDSYDVVCAFEVLEHLPFEKFGQCLKELKRASRRHVIISLPYWGRHFSIQIRLPFVGKINWQCKINWFPIKHEFNGEHYWEIGKKGYSLKRIKGEIKSARFRVIKDFNAFESPYHHFFVLDKVE